MGEIKGIQNLASKKKSLVMCRDEKKSYHYVYISHNMELIGFFAWHPTKESWVWHST